MTSRHQHNKICFTRLLCPVRLANMLTLYPWSSLAFVNDDASSTFLEFHDVKNIAVLAFVLRGHLIEMLRAKITKQKRAIITQQLMKYITSPQFKNPIEEVVQTSSDLQKMVKEEYDGHVRV